MISFLTFKEEERNQLRQQEELSLRDVEFAKILSVELNSNMVILSFVLFASNLTFKLSQ